MTPVSFVLHRSNSLERLVDRLAEVVAEPAGPPTAPEVAVVQSRGMERWVSQQLAQRLGIWANARFLFPRNLVEQVLRWLLDEERDVGLAYTRESLTWAVAALLPGLVSEPAFEPLRIYLEGDDTAVRRLQLARRLGDLFDQYVIYRPELVTAWERGEEDDWQARLWRAVVGRTEGRHLADRAGDCLARLARGDARLEALPGRVTLFGISTLPPLFLRVLSGLSAHLDVHLLQLSPCQEYWADLRPGDAPRDPAEQNLEANPLLASLGKLGRDFQYVLEEEVGYQEAPGDLYDDALGAGGAPTVLATLQSDILHQRRRSAASGDPGRAPPVVVDAADDSLMVHSCHGPMREAEVLRDQLLALFDADPTLEPRQVLVMTPDLETYAPYVDAALGATGEIPYSIADRSQRQELPVVEGFLAVLAVLGSRFPATALVDLLGHAAVRERFGLGDEAVDAVRGWISEAGICWGVDADHRAELGLPAYGENTWRFGLDRLLLAHALPVDGRTLFEGRLPCGGAAGDQAAGLAGLGGLAELCETLFELRTRLAAPRDLPAWRDMLAEVLDRTVSAQTFPLQHQLVREGLDRLAEHALAARFTDAVALDAIRDELTAGFAEPVGSTGFLTGGVTLCELLPMRSIPFRVIALLGMNDDAFPRKQRRLGFDRLSRQPRAGDRSTRDDDRYQILECVLAARERLLVTYVGQSSRDNSPLPPSVVVSELLDAAADSCVLPAGPWERLVVAHPLQPFSPRYFDAGDEPRLFSFDAAQAAGAARLRGERDQPARFITGLAPPEPTAELTVQELARFLDNPARALLQGTLGMTLGGEVQQLADTEPVALNGLHRWQLGSRLLAEALDGRDPAALYPVLRAAGELPLGGPGRLAFASLLPGVNGLREALEPWLSQPALEAQRVSVDVDGARLTGWLRGLRAGGLLWYRFGSLRGRDLLSGWVHHLALCATVGPGQALPDTTVLVGQAAGGKAADVRRFRSVADAREQLASLIRLYAVGQRVPLRLFPQASLIYARTLRQLGGDDADSRAKALDKAVNAFTTSRFTRGEDADLFVRQAHAGQEAVLSSSPPGLEGQGLGFADLALSVYGPLLDHLEATA